MAERKRKRAEREAEKQRVETARKLMEQQAERDRLQETRARQVEGSTLNDSVKVTDTFFLF